MRRPMSDANAPASCPDGHDGAIRLLSVFASTGAAATSGGPAPCRQAAVAGRPAAATAADPAHGHEVAARALAARPLVARHASRVDSSAARFARARDSRSRIAGVL
ncbi:MAG: hypothetical protein AB7J47_00555 [Acidimicrobiia bacterium]